MNYRELGQTGLQVSTLGFGCGAVGGLLVKGERNEMTRAVARAIERGVNYFDTAALYGNGRSETNLGAVLEELGADVIVGTKVRLAAEEMANIEQAIVNSVDASLRRLNRDRIDLIQLHNGVANQRCPERGWVSLEDVETAMRAFRSIREQGKVACWGFTGLGETSALQRALSGAVESVQSCFNLINPSAGMPVAAGFPYQDFAQLIDVAAGRRIGVIAIRVLAAGALSGTATRHANAAQNVAPIASGSDFAEDLERARRFNVLVDQGYADSLVEAAIRFVTGKQEVATALVGISNTEQLDRAVDAVEKGPLPAAALKQLDEIWASFSG